MNPAGEVFIPTSEERPRFGPIMNVKSRILIIV